MDMVLRSLGGGVNQVLEYQQSGTDLEFMHPGWISVFPCITWSRLAIPQLMTSEVGGGPLVGLSLPH